MTKRRTLEDVEWANYGVIKISYEIPPTRAIHHAWFAGDGHTDETDEELATIFYRIHPSYKILKITRQQLPDGEWPDDQTQNA